MTDTETNDRLFYEAGSDAQGCQIVAISGARHITVSNNDDLCGDSSTGFGATVAIDISRADVERLRDFLNQWLESPTEPQSTLIEHQTG
ncbi:hypothetical protein [Motiliproteus sp. MSK22-1]|uniref:hypothetical protein n=1 Tax=Motiliproteus sp. MSK22-1 TaxID=1897630 RepID=UPI000976803E|nr:hypothetical protein [Motiliproteus sp. MSK22-1]OMH39761.1 hypothetical protein BGP75_01515 [Motiliproteus sp. MSK22-1]